MKRTAFTGCAFLFGAAVVMAWAPSAWAQAACRQGYVWREAFPGDYVCVTPETRTQAAQDNGQADARRQPGGGAYGPNTCLSGFVWREARPEDLVCVTPETRTQTASDNAQAAARRAPSGPRPPIGSATVPRPTKPFATGPSTGGAAEAAAYRVSEWSRWTRADGGIEFRYRWGWNPNEARYATQVDALFQLRNPGPSVWKGAARSIDCSVNTITRGKDVAVQPGRTQEVTFLTPNCGTKDQPSFRPNIVKAGKID